MARDAGRQICAVLEYFQTAPRAEAEQILDIAAGFVRGRKRVRVPTPDGSEETSAKRRYRRRGLPEDSPTATAAATSDTVDAPPRRRRRRVPDPEASLPTPETYGDADPEAPVA